MRTFLFAMLVSLSYGFEAEVEFEKLERLANRGDKVAQRKLGIMFFKGSGTKENLKSAVYWLRYSVQGTPGATPIKEVGPKLKSGLPPRSSSRTSRTTITPSTKQLLEKINPQSLSIDYKALWSSFAYSSQKEKTFWDGITDWSSKHEIYSELNRYCAISTENDWLYPETEIPIDSYTGAVWLPRVWNQLDKKRDSRGNPIGLDSSLGFTGFAKIMSFEINTRKSKPRSRMILQYKSGFPVRAKIWSAEGVVQEERSHLNGKLHGPYSIYDSEGNKSFELNYKNGQLDGMLTSWRYINDLHTKIFEQTYKNGKLNGISSFFSSTQLGMKNVEINYLNGNKDGRLTRWHGNGQILEESVWKEGKLLSAKVWSENGQDCSMTKVTNGTGVIYSGDITLVGICKQYTDGNLRRWERWEKGIKRIEEKYNDDKSQWMRTSWNEKGIKRTERSYREGIMTRAKWWSENGKRRSDTKFSKKGIMSSVSFYEGLIAKETYFWNEERNRKLLTQWDKNGTKIYEVITAEGRHANEGDLKENEKVNKKKFSPTTYTILDRRSSGHSKLLPRPGLIVPRLRR